MASNPMAHLLRGGINMGADQRASAQDIAFRQQMAQMLLQQSQQDVPAQIVGGHYIRPNAGKVIANALSGLSGYSMMNQANREAADMARAQEEQTRAMFGLGGPQSQRPMQGQDTAQSFPVNMGAPQQPLAQMQQQSQQQPMFPLIPGMSPEQSYMIAQQIGVPEYLKLATQQNAPTNEQKNLAFLAPEQRNAILAGQALGDASRDGMQMVMGPDGRIQAIPVQGYATAQAQLAGAQARSQAEAQASQDLVTVNMPDGSTQQMPRAQAINLTSQQQPQSGVSQGGIGSTPSKEILEARADLPRLSAESEQIINSIDGILNHPGLEGSVGFQYGLSAIPGTDESDFVARHEQLQGQVFLQGFQQLKGGGAITEIEGRKAEQAIARLSRAQSEREYRNSLLEIRGIVQTALERARRKAGVEVDGAPQPPAPPQSFENGDYSSLWN